WLHAKRNLVLCGLTFQHAAGPIEAHKTVMVGHWWQPERGFTSGNVLIEDCVFQHNNNNQLYINWTDNVTLRNVVTRYGGYGGIIMDNVHNALWENIDNSFNHWRVGGGWASGAAKIHNTIGMVVRNYTAIGNTEGCGLWYDISCGNVTVDGATLIGNKIGLDWEISRGIHVRNAVVAGNARINVAIISGSDVTIENSIIAGAPRVGQFGFQASDRTSSENLAPLLGYPRVEKYLLDDLVIRNSAIVSHPQGPVGRVRESHNEGIDREGFVPPLFSQHHGSPDLFQRFLRNGVVDEANVWFSPKGSSAFGIRKLYPEDWQRRPTVNTWVDFAGWKRVVASRKSIFADPGFKSVVDFDFRPRAGGLVENMPLPRYTMPESTRSAWKAFVDAEHYRVDTRSNVVDVINP
ncbi:MAG TPA: right-handed parallel beta-helix repeat-containing protein, partial [Tepidisphaeraceae bacterium]|nr:right-handed parallel beta-helix repeat-containing protein [Tepidisphaeraceae bacterium]